jgi:hypothetical protein
MDLEKTKSEVKETIGEQNGSHALPHIEAFQSLSKKLRENVKKLCEMKKSGGAEASSKELIAQSFSSLVEMRTNHRSLYLVTKASLS